MPEPAVSDLTLIWATVRIPKGTVVKTAHPHRQTFTATRAMIVVITEFLPGPPATVRWRGMGGYSCEAADWELLSPEMTKVLDARLAAVATLHATRRRTNPDGLAVQWCRECQQDWPCPTIQIVQGEQPA